MSTADPVRSGVLRDVRQRFRDEEVGGGFDRRVESLRDRDMSSTGSGARGQGGQRGIESSFGEDGGWIRGPGRAARRGPRPAVLVLAPGWPSRPQDAVELPVQMLSSSARRQAAVSAVVEVASIWRRASTGGSTSRARDAANSFRVSAFWTA